MRIALKYGLLITAVVVVWIVLVRFVMGVGAESSANVIAPILFNLTQIVAIYLGVRERKAGVGGGLSFKECLKTGMRISLVYAVSSCLFFMIEYLVAGPKLLLSEVGGADRALWQIIVFVYAGLFLGSLFFGLIYSTLIAFFLARRVVREPTELI